MALKAIKGLVHTALNLFPKPDLDRISPVRTVARK